MTSPTWDHDSANPFNWPLTKKWRVMSIACVITFLTGLNATSITTVFPELSAEFNINDERIENTFFTVTAWNLAAAIFPMISLPLMESRGTCLVYSICYSIFIVFLIPQALASNFATLIISRVFAGAFGGTVQNAAEGVAANLFKTSEERLDALTLYIFSLLAGVTMGPVLGAVVAVLNWRWVFWIQLIMNSVVLPLTLFCMPETRGSVIVSRTSGRDKSGPKIVNEISKVALFFFMLWCAFSFGLIFISTESIAQVFKTAFGFEGYQTGLVQSSMFVGEVVGGMICLAINKYYAQSNSTESVESSSVDEKPIPNAGTKPVLERSLHFSIPATILGLAGGLFTYAWTSKGQFPWIGPAIGLALQGCATQIIVNAVTIYITDSYERCAASAVAGIAFGENTFAAFLPLASLPMYSTLGFQWASSLLGFVALALSAAPIVLTMKGPQIRARSKAISAMSWYGQ